MTPNDAREIDSALKDLSNEELEEAIRLLNELAEIAIYDYLNRHKEKSKWAAEMVEKMDTPGSNPLGMP